MRLKYKPEDFSVRESWTFETVPGGGHVVYAMDKQKLTTFQAVELIAKAFRLPRSAISFCGLKDKQGRTEQLIAIKGEPISFQTPELKLRVVGETDAPLSARNTNSNRFGVTVRDLTEPELARVPEAVAEVNRLGVINYFDSQRFGHLKHGQGFIAKDVLKGDWEHALHNLIAQPSPLDQSSDKLLKTWWSEHWGDWRSKGPVPDPRTYAILRALREDPKGFKKAFLSIEPRYRALILFTYQSYLWNEGVKLALLELLPRKSLCQIPYQVGQLLFPREAPAATARFLREASFPLLGPDSADRLPAADGDGDPQPAALRRDASYGAALRGDVSYGAALRRAVETSLRREKLTLPGLAIPDSPLFFKHEERALTVVPGKLWVSAPERDEYFRGRHRIRLSFTLPSGAYATLVVRRLFWFSEARERDMEDGRAIDHRATPPLAARSEAGAGPNALQRAGSPVEAPGAVPRPTPLGFLAKKRARKDRRALLRQAAAAQPKAKSGKAKKTSALVRKAPRKARKAKA